jgi:hypothetical protein
MITKKSILAAVSFVILSSVAMTASAGEVLKCEKRSSPERSKVSVQAEDLKPGALFTAIVTSGANSATSLPVAADALGNVEYDFDSNPRDIRAGANPIASSFIVGGTASVSVKDALGNSVASATANCRTR